MVLLLLGFWVGFDVFYGAVLVFVFEVFHEILIVI